MLIYRMIKKILLKEHALLILTFPFLLILGLNIYKDYGISIDEESTRMHGLVSLNYICELFFPDKKFNFQLINNIPDLNSYPFKEYGVFFEIFLILIIEVFLKITEFSEIFYTRHLFTNLLFLSSLIFFYFTSLNIFKNKYYSLLSVLILYTSPRIFAESFYNDKDIVFLSFFIYSVFFAIKFLKKMNLTNACLLALVLSITINIRVIGIYLLLLIIFFLIIKILMENIFFLKKINLLIFFIFLNFIFLYAFWPFLWQAPLENSLYALKSFSKYPWGGYVFYLGDFYKAKYLPWHYSFVYFFATTPLLLSAIILPGIYIIAFRFVKRLIKINDSQPNNDIWKSNKEKFLLFIFFTVISPLFLIYIFNSITYNGWRHLYFLFPSLILIGIYFIERISIQFNKKKIAIALPTILIFIFINNLYNLVKLHPYQYIYFNLIFERKANKLFEIDYWGVANKQSLEKIIKSNLDKNKMIIGVASFTDLYLSKKMLPKNLRKKIIISGQNFDDADFIFNNNYSEINPKFDDKYSIPHSFKKYSSLKKGNILINEFYKKDDKLK